ncbi:MAG: CinA family protein [Bdellovibrionales bacterium]
MERLSDRFKKSAWTLGFAESCTGGLIAAGLAAQPGVSREFL